MPSPLTPDWTHRKWLLEVEAQSPKLLQAPGMVAYAHLSSACGPATADEKAEMASLPPHNNKITTYLLHRMEELLLCPNVLALHPDRLSSGMSEPEDGKGAKPLSRLLLSAAGTAVHLQCPSTNYLFS
jgi:hypothetical protein